jgi:hypothetical protein
MTKKIPSLTFWINLVCAIAAAGSELLADPTIMGLFPPKIAHVVTAVALTAMWIRSHKNIFVNPDNTPATRPYDPNAVAGSQMAMKKPDTP